LRWLLIRYYYRRDYQRQHFVLPLIILYCEDISEDDLFAANNLPLAVTFKGSR
jgi:hypothetical protein